MKNTKFALVSFFAALALAGGILAPTLPACAAGVASSTRAQVGKAAPDFTLTDSNGKKQTLSQYKGKFVVLEWINFDCPFVKKHYHSGNMQSLQDKYTKQGVVWLSINTSKTGGHGYYPAAQVNAKLKAFKAHPTAYLQDDGTVGHMYGAKATPHMFIINPSGTLVYAGAIDSIDSTDEADVKTAKNYVAAALDAAMAGKPVAISATKAYGCFVHYN